VLIREILSELLGEGARADGRAQEGDAIVVEARCVRVATGAAAGIEAVRRGYLNWMSVRMAPFDGLVIVLYNLVLSVH